MKLPAIHYWIQPHTNPRIPAPHNAHPPNTKPSRYVYNYAYIFSPADVELVPRPRGKMFGPIKRTLGYVYMRMDIHCNVPLCLFQGMWNLLTSSPLPSEIWSTPVEAQSRHKLPSWIKFLMSEIQNSHILPPALSNFIPLIFFFTVSPWSTVISHPPMVSGYTGASLYRFPVRYYRGVGHNSNASGPPTRHSDGDHRAFPSANPQPSSPPFPTFRRKCSVTTVTEQPTPLDNQNHSPCRPPEYPPGDYTGCHLATRLRSRISNWW